ncbi:hypothetical protein MVEN_02603800 [Mycena venus]|uniref:Uncharacterized protein n=1 Tax=Mycena venus TaxID=2733690 RepID=A0A8H6U1A5_9AGAR|nr:hypothetical protein MVEN_02603800 [Mycena venus]
MGDSMGTRSPQVTPPFPPNTPGVPIFPLEKPDKEGFLTGHDLLMSHGLPWQLPIWEVVWRPAYHGILDVLTADGFAPPLLKQACMSLNVARDSVFITALGDPWAVDWSKEFSRVYFVRPLHSPVAALVRHPWYSRNASRNAPYTGRGLVSVIKMPDGELGLRIDKVLTLQRHAMNLKTALPVEGLVTSFLPRLIHKSTKVSEEQMDKQVNHVTFPVSQLPLAPANPNPFDIYHHEVHTLADVRHSPNHPPTKAKDPPAHKPMPGHFCVQPPSPSRAANSEAQNPTWDAVSRSLPPINNTSQPPWDASLLSLASDARSTVPPPPRPTESSRWAIAPPPRASIASNHGNHVPNAPRNGVPSLRPEDNCPRNGPVLDASPPPHTPQKSPPKHTMERNSPVTGYRHPSPRHDEGSSTPGMESTTPTAGGGIPSEPPIASAQLTIALPLSTL